MRNEIDNSAGLYGNNDTTWKFRALFENDYIALAFQQMIYDEAGNPEDFLFLEVNERFKMLAGLDPTGMTAKEAFPGIEKDSFDWIGTFGHVAKTGEMARFEQWMEHNGLWCEHAVYQYQPDCFVTAITDISKRKEAAKRVADSEQKYHSLFNNMSVGFALHEMVLDLNGKPVDYRFLEINPAFELLTGLKSENLIGKTCLDVLPGIEPYWIELYGKVVLTGESATFDNYSRELKRHYQVTAYSSGELKFAVVFVDITERKEAERALKMSEEKFYNLFNNHSAVKLLIDVESGNVVDANVAASHYYGWSKEELIHKKISDINILSESEVKNRIKQIKTGEQKSFEFRHLHKDGSITDVEVFTSKIKIGEKELLHSIIHDISERKQAEEKLKSNFLLLRVAGATARFGGWSYKIGDEKMVWSDLVCDIHEVPRGYAANLSEGVNFYAPESIETIERVFTNCIERGIPYDEELQIITAKGNKIWVRSTGEAERDENGKVVKVQGSFQDINERKLADEANRKTQEMFRTVFNQSPFGIALVDTTSGVNIEVNENFARIAGRTREEMKKVDWMSITHPEDLEEDLQYMVRLNAGEMDSFSMNKRYIRPDGSFVWIHMTVAPIKSDENLPPRHLCMIENITARKQAEDALKQSEEKFRSIVNSLPSAMYFYRLDNSNRLILIGANPSADQIVGMSHESLIGKSIEEAFPNLANTETPEMYKKVALQEIDSQSFEISYQDERFSGYYSVSVFRTQERTIAVNFLDVSDRKMAELALRESEEKFRSLFSEMTEMVVLHNLVYDEFGNPCDYRIIDCNDAFSKSTGYSHEAAVGKLASELYEQNPPPYLAVYADVALTGNTCELNTYYEKLDRYFQISVVSTVRGSFATITSDITEMRRYNDMLIEKNKELESYVYITSHDLRSPLVNIQGFSARLKKQTDLMCDALKECDMEESKKLLLEENITKKIPLTLDFIFNNVSKMDKMLNGLLQISRTGKITMSIQRIDMHSLISTIVQSVEFQLNEANATVQIGKLPSCYGDENMLSQLFTNMIGNAIKYRHASRNLRIRISGIETYHRVRYCIEDNGIGISKQYLDKIWNVFYRIDHKQTPGEGMGLSIAKRITDKHKGKIWVESTENEGSKFYIELWRVQFEE
jgi:PAS domain S-box-containing protein